MAKVLILFYSAYGHIYRMAEAVAEGVRKVEGVEAVLRRVPETLPKDLLDNLGITQAQKVFSHIPVATYDELAEYDAIILGTPTRFGNMVGQMRAFLDGTGALWANDTFVGKIGSVFTSTATQHGGQETTIISTMLTLLHLGMIIVGLSYAYKPQMTMDEITGGSPYGASTIAGGDGSRMPSKNELDAARFQGERVAKITKKLFS